MKLSLSLSKSARADDLISIYYLATQASALDQTALGLLKGNTFFLASLFGDKTVIEIFPERPMLAKIDLNGYPAAFSISQKLDTSHVVPLSAGQSIT
jgi:hypothetical protein